MAAKTSGNDEHFEPRQGSGGNDTTQVPWWILARALGQRQLKRMPTAPANETVQGKAKSKQLKGQEARGTHVKEPRPRSISSPSSRAAYLLQPQECTNGKDAPYLQDGKTPFYQHVHSDPAHLGFEMFNKVAQALDTKVWLRYRSAAVKVRVHYNNKRQSLAKNNQEYLQYVARDGADRDGQKVTLFTEQANSVTSEAYVKRIQEHGDGHAFRMIVAFDPRDKERIDVMDLTRTFMRQVERDLGNAKLDWIAGAHYDKPHAHAHIVLRGKDLDQKDLIIEPDYLQNGLRYRASQIVTKALGSQVYVRARDQFYDISVTRVLETTRSLGQAVYRAFAARTPARSVGTPVQVSTAALAKTQGLNPAGTIAQTLVNNIGQAKTLDRGPELER